MNTYLTTEQRTELIEDYISHWGDIIDQWAWDDEALNLGLSENELRTALNSLSNPKLYRAVEIEEFPETLIMTHRTNAQD